MQNGYYSVIGILAIIVHLIVNSNQMRTKFNTLSPLEKLYRIYLGSVMAYFITDAFWGILDALRLTSLLYLDTVAYYIAMASSVVLWCKYVSDYINLTGKPGRALNIFGNVFFASEIIALIINPFYHIFFWFDENGIYHAYPFRYLALAVQVLMFMAIAVISFNVARHSKHSQRRRNGIMCFFCVSMVVTVVAQIIFPFLPIYSVGLLIATCGLHVYVLEDEKEEIRRSLKDTDNIIKTANMGLWTIILFDDEPPRMKASETMRQLLALPDDVTDEAEIYEAWHSRIKPEALESVNQSVAEMFEGKKSENTYLWNHPDLGDQYVRCGGTGVKVKNRGYILRGYHYNVNEEVLKEQKREAEQRRITDLRLHTISEAIHGGFKLGKNDDKFSFIMVSEQLAQLLGYDSPSELMDASGGCMAGLANLEDTEREMPKAREAVKNGEMYTMHYRVRCKDGSWKNVEDRGRLMVNEKGEEEYWSFIVDQDQIAELESANEAKSNFLFNMSHDIRTPMNAILGYTALIKKELTDPKLLDYEEKIEQAGSLLLSLINNVLDMARIESGKTELDEDLSNIEPVISEIINVTKTEADKKNIEVTHSIDVKNDNFFCDETKIKEILINLLSNAVKYTPNGGKVSLTVQEIPCDREGFVRIETRVKDTGIGMSKDFIPHLFDSFSRERNTTTGKIAGTGLGMSIVKKLVELMDGSISVESELGKGTEFTVVLDHRIANVCHIERKSGTVSEAERAELLNGRHVLLAEDNDLNAEIASVMLSDMGLVIDRVDDGIKCVAQIEQMPAGTYDVILMDIQMPNMDGYKATQAIRNLSDDVKAQIPIIAMTANAFDSDKKKALDFGMNGHIAKPIDIEKVEEILLAVFAENKD
ncbi:MAG: ATP-binding protein [Eubacteriales bacterium]|nr:ATP-binding protein [Eubacteriales bacterium]